MNHQLAKQQLFDQTFLIGAWRRRKALKFLFERGDAEAIRILVDAVERGHPAANTILEFFSRLAEREPVEAMVAGWAAKRLPSLTPVVVERALTVGVASLLPLDRQTAWLVAPYLRGQDGRASAAETYVRCVVQQQPDFLPAFVFKTGRGDTLERKRAVQAQVLKLLQDDDPEVRAGAEAWLKALPNTQQWNDPIVAEWIRTQSPFLASLVAEPRLPSDPAKEALLHLVNRNVAGYRKLEDRDGALLAEALAMASPQMRQVINEVVLGAKDGALADAYRRATSRGADADPQLAQRALMASGNEDALFDVARGKTLADVLPFCRHWAETGRRPTQERHRQIVERAAAAIQQMPELDIEPTPPLPPGTVDLIEHWRNESLSDAQVRQDLGAQDPLARARALLQGSERGLVDEATLRGKATSQDWPERLVVALQCPGAITGKDSVQWLNDCAGTDGDLLSARLECGPEELQRSQALCAALRQKKGALAARNLALAEILLAFRTLSGGAIRVLEDDSAHQKGAVRVGTRDVGKEELSF